MQIFENSWRARDGQNESFRWVPILFKKNNKNCNA